MVAAALAGPYGSNNYMTDRSPYGRAEYFHDGSRATTTTTMKRFRLYTVDTSLEPGRVHAFSERGPACETLRGYSRGSSLVQGPTAVYDGSFDAWLLDLRL